MPEPARETITVKGNHRTDHHHLTVGEVDQADDAVNHRVTQSDERVDSAQGEAVDQLLEESVHNQAFRNKVLLAYRMFRGMPPRRRPHKSWARLVLSGCGCRKNEGMAGAIPSGSSC
jgi:hypothetical protein